ncbi:UNVERIFIED_CONTAM: hypothetical protein Slati_2498800 [Sesamum latifolium]|uniref:Uncharacterized protein n=1 Tax=Sesamum latifolium TaxID=2727402 RepID=A0AAW2WEK3_9LAMI
MGLSTNEKEFLALLLAITKWKHYLQGNHFIIRTNQKSLKHILDQRIDSILQQKWITKLLGLSYEVQYKKGSENRAADALSRVEHDREESQTNAITTQVPLWIQDVQGIYEGNTLFQTVVYEAGVLRRNGRICVGSHGGVREKIIKSMHDSALGGHSGNGTYQRIKPLFYWPTLKGDVNTWVKECETDGQTERVNQCLENYLRCMCHQKPKKWAQWLTLAEFWFITNFHTGLKDTPFQALYGYPPHQLTIGPYMQNHHSDVEELMKERVKVMQLLKENLQHAQQRMKLYADKKRTEREFQVGDEVFLKLQPYGQTSVALRKPLKLSAKYYGPYKVLEKIGKVSYKLALPSGSKIHPVFHVSLLKKKIGSRYFSSVNIPEFEDEVFKVYPSSILARRLVPRNNVGVPQVLIQWSHGSPDQATWEDYKDMVAKFPGFDPWGQGSKKEEGMSHLLAKMQL